MSGKFVRASKYRHVFGQTPKKELWYENIKVTLNAWDSNLIKTNGRFISVNWNTSAGGSFAVIPIEEHGKVPDVVPLFRGHTAQVLDTDFDPFDDYRIATCSDDAKICLFEIPRNYTFLHREIDEEGEVQDVHPVKELSGHGKKVGHILFSPVAKDVLASSSMDHTVKIWNLESGKDEITLAHPEMVMSMSFSYDGNYLATVARDKVLRVWDIRSRKIVSESKAHEGAKNQRVIWLGNNNRLATTGFSKMSDRQVALWSSFELEKGPLGKFYIIDQAPGVLMPFYDDGNKLLFLVGKGDGNIRYYEFKDDILYELSEYLSTDPQRGFAVAPRSKLNLKDNEIMKCFKTVVDTCIQPISFYVPRRSEAFQHDIYPDAPSDQPALTAEEWFGGKSVEGPLLINLQSLYDELEVEIHPAKKEESKKEESEKKESVKEEPEKNEPKGEELDKANEQGKDEETHNEEVKQKESEKDPNFDQENIINNLLKKSSDIDASNNAEDPSKDSSDWDDGDENENYKAPGKDTSIELRESEIENNMEQICNKEARDKRPIDGDGSAKDDSTKDDSVKDNSTKDDSTKDDSVKDNSTKDDSTKDQLTKDDSVKDQSTEDNSVKDQLTKDVSVKDRSTKDHSVNDDSTKNDSVKDESTKDVEYESTKDNVKETWGPQEEPEVRPVTNALKLEESAEKLSGLIYNLEGVVKGLTKANLEKNERLELLETKIEHLLNKEESQ